MYDTDPTMATGALQAGNPTVFSDATIANILALTTSKSDNFVNFTTAVPDAKGNVSVAAGAEVVIINAPDASQTTVKPPANAPVVIFQGKGGVIATINDAAATVPSGDQSHVDRVVVGSAGNDRIIVQDAKNTQIILGSGDSSVQTGRGVDTVEAGLGNSTIVGGGGDYAVVKLKGAPTNYTVAVNNGHAVVTDMLTKKTTDISKIQYVQLDNGKALVFAANSLEAQISLLYHTAFGRDADAGGLDYWFDLAKGGASFRQIADSFTHSSEFAKVAALSNDAFVNGLYQNTFGRAGEESGVNYWIDDLAHGATRAELITSFSQIGVNNITGTINTEAQVVGQITVVTGIV
ncbi:MAG: DUF4214 domain-containing protein [Burkholderiaceae bacterium]|nr:DUF4214 domain-containing protein [Burkholderiaceae bacterium]